MVDALELRPQTNGRASWSLSLGHRGAIAAPIGHQHRGAFDAVVGCACHVFRPAGESLTAARLICPMHGGVS